MSPLSAAPDLAENNQPSSPQAKRASSPNRQKYKQHQIYQGSNRRPVSPATRDTMLHDSCTTVKRRLNCRYTAVTRPLPTATRQLHDGYTTVTRQLHGSQTAGTRRLHGGYTTVTRWLQDDYADTSAKRRLHGSYTLVTRRLYGDCTTVTRPLHDGYTTATPPIGDG